MKIYKEIKNLGLSKIENSILEKHIRSILKTVNEGKVYDISVTGVKIAYDETKAVFLKLKKEATDDGSYNPELSADINLKINHFRKKCLKLIAEYLICMINVLECCDNYTYEYDRLEIFEFKKLFENLEN